VYKYRKIKDFAAELTQGVGSSNIPTLAGLNLQYENGTPYMLWRQKKGLDPPSIGGERADWGHRLEPLILARWVEKHFGKETAAEYLAAKIRGRSYEPFKTNTKCNHPEYPWARSHADLLIDSPKFFPVKCPKCGSEDEYPSGFTGECTNRCGQEIHTEEAYIVEAKSAGFFSAKRDEDNPDAGFSKSDFSASGVPARVFLQVQWQLFTYGVRVAYVAVLIDTGEWREYGPIIADPRVQEKCLALGQRFQNLVDSNTPPQPENWADVATMWPTPVEQTAVIGGDEELKVREMITRYHEAGKREKEASAEREDIKNALGILMGENMYLRSPEGTQFASSWTVDSEYLKAAEVKKKYPAEWEKYLADGLVTKLSRRDMRPAKLK
jgi:hypothetical protein